MQACGGLDCDGHAGEENHLSELGMIVCEVFH